MKTTQSSLMKLLVPQDYQSEERASSDLNCHLTNLISCSSKSFCTQLISAPRLMQTMIETALLLRRTLTLLLSLTHILNKVLSLKTAGLETKQASLPMAQTSMAPQTSRAKKSVMRKKSEQHDSKVILEVIQKDQI